MKIAVIGAGSTYTPELIEGIINYNSELGTDEICLMDINFNKLKSVGSLCNRMVEKAGLKCKVVLTEDLDEAITDASYILSQIRVGGLQARVLDETIPLKYNLIGQETTGMGGFFNALRAIPPSLNIAKRMEVLCPNAWLINFSNPSGLITQMLLNKTNIKAIGLCNVPINMVEDLREKLDLPNAEVEFIGLNHFDWVTSITSDGAEYIGNAIDKELTGFQMKNIAQTNFDYSVVRNVGAIPNSYLQYYYFEREKLKFLKGETKSRGELCIDIENQLLEIFLDQKICEKPEILAQRGGARYSEAAVSLICAIQNDKHQRHVVNIKNNGAIPYMASDDVVEIAAIVGKNGAVPIQTKNHDNIHIKTMVQTVKEFEKFTIDAAIEGDDLKAMNALLLHPLTRDYENSKKCYEEMKNAHRNYLPKFWK